MQSLDTKQISDLFTQMIDDCVDYKHVLVRSCGKKNIKKFNILKCIEWDAERTADAESMNQALGISILALCRV